MKPLEIGNTTLEPVGSKDAIHVPVACVIAGLDLSAGEKVLIGGGVALRLVSGEPTGIVDPFLVNGVKRGHRFWLFLRPGSIENLRHEWDHDDFPEPDPPDPDYDDGCRGCY